MTVKFHYSSFSILLIIFLFAKLTLVSCDVNLSQFTVGKLKKDGIYDLEATYLRHSPDTIKVGDKVVFEYKISNIGKDDVPQGVYDVVLYLDDMPIAFDKGTSAIKSGKYIEYEMAEGYYHWKPQKRGHHQLKLIIDKDNNLPETDISNNQIVLSIEVK